MPDDHNVYNSVHAKETKEIHLMSTIPIFP